MLLQTHSDSLAGLLERLRDEAETEKRLLGEELEDVLEDLSELEKKEECSEEAIQHLTQKNQTLEQELTNTCFELEKWGLKISNWVEIELSFNVIWALSCAGQCSNVNKCIH